jgi:uncharacterized protein
MTLKSIIIAASLGLLATPAQAQSFNCRHAHTADEVLICQEPWLSQLDQVLSREYARLRNNLTGAPRQRLQSTQTTWLKFRRGCGRDMACIENLYQKRLKALTGRTLEEVEEGGEEGWSQ